jgi:crotonobetainyl-CoA:carnitine CoA-transferase CaiB-like acyl-CoA transferase
VDGEVFLLIVEQHQWIALVDMLRFPEFSTWPVFAEPLMPGANNDVLMPMVAECIPRMSTDELVARLQSLRIPCAPLNSMKTLADDPQLAHRRFFVEIPHEDDGIRRYPGAPYHLSETPWAIRRPAPRLGEHNLEVFSALPSPSLEPSSESAVSSQNAGCRARRRALLEGVRVLDFIAVWAGPASTKELARLGAEVIRVDTTTRRRQVTSVGPHGITVSGYTSPWVITTGSRGCSSI